MESWRLVLRTGFMPLWPTKGLEALLHALRTDDSSLIQGATSTPPPLMSVEGWPCEAADAVAYVGWKGEDLLTVGEVEEFFARACFEADQRLGEPAACRRFLNWFDDTPRDEMIAELIPEIEAELRRRGEVPTLPTEFQSALTAEPSDRVLRGAVADWYSEQGFEEEATRWRRP